MQTSAVFDQVLGNQDLLASVLRSAIFPPGRVPECDHGSIRLVSKAWKAAADQLVRQELKEVRLHRQLFVSPGQVGIQPGRVARSALVQSLAGAESADMELVCSRNGLTAHSTCTLAVNSLLLQGMPALRQLILSLPATLAGHVDRALPRSAHLTSLAVAFTDLMGYSNSGACFDTQDALISALTHLPGLQDVSLQKLPAEVGLAPLAASLPPALTSLQLAFSFSYAEDPAEQKLRHLSGLTRLERLSVSGCLRGLQALPPELSRLSFLDLSHNRLPHGWDAALELDFRGAGAGLLELSLHSADMLWWPRGLGDLSSLTALDLRACEPADAPTALMLPPQLRCLRAGVVCECGGHPAQRLPELAHLTALEHLECTLCRVAPLVEALPSLARLTHLQLTRCNMERQGALKVGHLRGLAALSLRSCSLDAYPQGLRACSALTLLDLSRNTQLGGAKPRLQLTGLPVLRELALSDCGLKRFPAGITKLNLERLNLRGNSIVPSRAESKWLEAEFEQPPADARAEVVSQWVYSRRVSEL